eukprot:1146438-Pelagomonas_calceolata.AAC.2
MGCLVKIRGRANGDSLCIREWAIKAHPQCSRSFGLSRYSAILWSDDSQSPTALLSDFRVLRGSIVHSAPPACRV